MRQLVPWQPHRCGACGWCSRALIAVVVLAVGLTSAAFGQPSRKPAGPPGGPSAGHGADKTKKKTVPTKSGTATKGPATPKPAEMPLVLDPEKLPDGYSPPPNPPELMTLDQPLLNDDELAANKKLLGKYREKLRKGENQTKEDKDIIEKGLKYRLYVMTHKDQERDLHRRREELVQDLRTAGSILSKADQQAAFRKAILLEVIRLADPLLKNSFYVRLQAATLLGELELVPADPNKNIKLEMFTPACEPLIKVLDDPEQPLPVKIAAARSLVRLCKYSGLNLPPVEMRHRIAKSVLNELAKANTHYWYQMRLVEVLSTLDIALDLQTRKPFVVTALQDVLNDPQRDWHVRAEAAWALGRTPFDPGQVDVPAVMRDIMQFALDLAKAAQQSPTDPKWKTCLFRVYLAFQPASADDREATRRTRAGLLNSPLTTAQSQAQEPYKLIVPIVNAVINDKPITAQMLQALDAWLQKAKPQVNANANNVGAATVGPE